MLLHHLAQDHPDQIPAYVAQTNAGQAIAEAAAVIYETNRVKISVTYMAG